MSAERDEFLRDGAQQPEVVVDGDKRQRVQRACIVNALVRGENFDELWSFCGLDVDVGWNIGVVNVEEVEERMGGMRVVSAEGLETELPVHEDDCIARLEEVLCRCSSASS